MANTQAASGDILVYTKVRNPDAKMLVARLLDDLPGERITPNLYEVFTADWDEGLWEEEVERLLSIIDPAYDTLIYWQASGDTLIRTCLAGRGA